METQDALVLTPSGFSPVIMSIFLIQTVHFLPIVDFKRNIYPSFILYIMLCIYIDI